MHGDKENNGVVGGSLGLGLRILVLPGRGSLRRLLCIFPSPATPLESPDLGVSVWFLKISYTYLSSHETALCGKASSPATQASSYHLVYTALNLEKVC